MEVHLPVRPKFIFETGAGAAVCKLFLRTDVDMKSDIRKPSQKSHHLCQELLCPCRRIYKREGIPQIFPFHSFPFTFAPFHFDTMVGAFLQILALAAFAAPCSYTPAIPSFTQLTRIQLPLLRQCRRPSFSLSQIPGLTMARPPSPPPLPASINRDARRSSCQQAHQIPTEFS